MSSNCRNWVFGIWRNVFSTISRSTTGFFSVHRPFHLSNLRSLKSLFDIAPKFFRTNLTKFGPNRFPSFLFSERIFLLGTVRVPKKSVSKKIGLRKIGSSYRKFSVEAVLWNFQKNYKKSWTLSHKRISLYSSYSTLKFNQSKQLKRSCDILWRT